MNNFWVPASSNEEALHTLTNEMGLQPSFAGLLVSIGITTKEEAERFLHPSLKQFHNPMTVFDMEKAVERIMRAIRNGERILFHGDYDCDGVTTISVAVRGFALLGVQIDFYAPNRFEDGYGLNERNMKRFASEYDLIISGDTGIRAWEGAKAVWDADCDLIITDHHEPFVQTLDKMDEAPEHADIITVGEHYMAIPKAYAVIDPHRIDDTHACKTHAGVGVIFKVMMALFRAMDKPVKPLLELLDLVATGTIADLAQQIDRRGNTLDFEVRAMCAAGIQIMNDRPSVWVQALKEASGLQPESLLTGETIGFTFGPTLNAVGRLYDPLPAVEILLEDDIDVALEMGKELREVNAERQEQTRTAFKLIDELKESGEEERYDYGIVVHSDLYGEGIAGLVSDKFRTAFYRPAIALTTAEKDGEVVYKGSGRSIEGVHILHMLDEVKRAIGPFVYGGHTMAAGMTIRPDQLEGFTKAFREACMKHDSDTFIPTYTYHSTAELDEINDSFMRKLTAFEPFGQGNEAPVFLMKNLLVSNPKAHKNEKGFGMTVRQNRASLRAMSFDLWPVFKPLYMETLAAKKEVHVDLLVQPSYNEWNGVRSIQLGIVDIKISS